jgi:hypothetical protein
MGFETGCIFAFLFISCATCNGTWVQVAVDCLFTITNHKLTPLKEKMRSQDLVYPSRRGQLCSESLLGFPEQPRSFQNVFVDKTDGYPSNQCSRSFYARQL